MYVSYYTVFSLGTQRAKTILQWSWRSIWIGKVQVQAYKFFCSMHESSIWAPHRGVTCRPTNSSAPCTSHPFGHLISGSPADLQTLLLHARVIHLGTSSRGHLQTYKLFCSMHESSIWAPHLGVTCRPTNSSAPCTSHPFGHLILGSPADLCQSPTTNVAFVRNLGSRSMTLFKWLEAKNNHVCVSAVKLKFPLALCPFPPFTLSPPYPSHAPCPSGW